MCGTYLTTLRYIECPLGYKRRKYVCGNKCFLTVPRFRGKFWVQLIRDISKTFRKKRSDHFVDHKTEFDNSACALSVCLSVCLPVCNHFHNFLTPVQFNSQQLKCYTYVDYLDGTADRENVCRLYSVDTECCQFW